MPSRGRISEAFQNKRKVTFYINYKIVNKLRKLEGISQSLFVEKAVEEALEKIKKEEK